MTISSPDAEAFGKGIAALTSLGKTKKKRDHSPEGTNENNVLSNKPKSNTSTVVAADDARAPSNLGNSLRPSSDHSASHDTSTSFLSFHHLQKTLLKKPKKKEKNSVFKVVEDQGSKDDGDTESPRMLRPPHPSDSGRSPYVPPTLEEINRYNHSGPRRSGILTSDALEPILETKPSPPDLFVENREKSDDVKMKDYSIRSHMVTERIRFEIFLEHSGEEVDVRTRALVVFGKLVNLDPSRKIMAYHDDDSENYPILQQAHDLPVSIDALSKYISAPMFNPKAKKIQFHTRFCTVTSLLEMKRDPGFMSWLKTNKIYTSVMTLNSTENTRVGFFFGKCPHITNITAFSRWIKSRIATTETECPEFQLNIEIIGRHKDPSTRTRAIVVICSRQDVRQLRDLLDKEFHAKSNFPFSPFQVMYTLDARTQSALYKAHKSRTFGPDMIEVTIPGFHELDTSPQSGNKSLRDMCFELADSQGQNIFVDVDNATRSQDTVLQVRKAEKTAVLDHIATWIKNSFHIMVKWNESNQYDTSTYRLDPKSRELANQLSAIANVPALPTPGNLKTPPTATIPVKRPSNHPAVNAWLDLTKVREISGITPSGKPSTQDDEATVTTLSESTLRSSSITRTEASEKFKKIGSNVRNLSYRHKKVEAGLECLETEVALQLNTLFRCVELHHNRLERLEAANERQVEIQIKHLQITLDPVAAKRDGTFSSLKKLLMQEIHQAQQDKIMLETERALVFEGTHAEDQDFINRKQNAGKLYDYFHAKIDETGDNSDFDIAQISDVSDDETTASQGSISGPTKLGATKDEGTVDEEMPDAKGCEDGTDENCTDDTTRQDNFKAWKKVSTETSGMLPLPPDDTHESRDIPLSWDSDTEDEDVITQPTSEQQWTTTPTRAKPVPTEPMGRTQRNTLKARSSARNLFKKAFPVQLTENRFSPLQEEPPVGDMETTTPSKEFFSYPSTSDDDMSYKENAEDSLDDSIDGMSLISTNELDDLAADTLHYDEDGYDTDTTDNTSPSKPSKTPHRKSSLHARLRISELYTAPDALLGNNFVSTSGHSRPPSNTLPHPSLNTPTHSGGHGAGST
jgi:hypothetical protein